MKKGIIFLLLFVALAGCAEASAMEIPEHTPFKEASLEPSMEPVMPLMDRTYDSLVTAQETVPAALQTYLEGAEEVKLNLPQEIKGMLSDDLTVKKLYEDIYSVTDGILLTDEEWNKVSPYIADGTFTEDVKAVLITVPRSFAEKRTVTETKISQRNETTGDIEYVTVPTIYPDVYDEEYLLSQIGSEDFADELLYYEGLAGIKVDEEAYVACVKRRIEKLAKELAGDDEKEYNSLIDRALTLLSLPETFADGKTVNGIVNEVCNVKRYQTDEELFFGQSKQEEIDKAYNYLKEHEYFADDYCRKYAKEYLDFFDEVDSAKKEDFIITADADIDTKIAEASEYLEQLESWKKKILLYDKEEEEARGGIGTRSMNKDNPYEKGQGATNSILKGASKDWEADYKVRKEAEKKAAQQRAAEAQQKAAEEAERAKQEENQKILDDFLDFFAELPYDTAYYTAYNPDTGMIDEKYFNAYFYYDTLPPDPKFPTEKYYYYGKNNWYAEFTPEHPYYYNDSDGVGSACVEYYHGVFQGVSRYVDKNGVPHVVYQY